MPEHLFQQEAGALLPEMIFDRLEMKMTKKEALHILMMSPLYFKQDLLDRKELFHSFYGLVSGKVTCDFSSRS